MIQRLCDLQTAEATSHFRPAQAHQNLPQDSQDEAAQTSSVVATQQNETRLEELEKERKVRDGESSRSASKAKSLENGGCSSSSTRLLPDFVYQASPDPASREMEDTQGEGGGKKPAINENGRKAKQKLNFTTCRTEEEAKRDGSWEQLANSSSWSEMSSVVIGSDYCLSPLSTAMEQRLILQYLTPLGDYQEVRVQSAMK